MSTIASGDIRKFLVINTTEYNNDGQYGVFVADTKDLEHYGIEPARKQFEIVNTGREVCADDMGVGEVAESTDFHGAYLIRLADWLKTLSYKVDGVLTPEKEWNGPTPICGNPLLEPAIYWTSGRQPSYNGGDRLGLQIDTDRRLHIVYSYTYNWSDGKPTPIRKIMQPEQLYGIPAETAKKAIANAIKWVFKQRR